jgi:nucleoside-diphosphate-sugar epimerase
MECPTAETLFEDYATAAVPAGAAATIARNQEEGRTALILHQNGHVTLQSGSSKNFTQVSKKSDQSSEMRVLRAQGVAGMAFNLGTGDGTPSTKLCAFWRSLPDAPPMRAAGPVDIRDSQADILVARKKLGFNPRIGFEEGLRRIWDWHLAPRSR